MLLPSGPVNYREAFGRENYRKGKFSQGKGLTVVCVHLLALGYIFIFIFYCQVYMLLTWKMAIFNLTVRL
jgi:hypothetical protein